MKTFIVLLALASLCLANFPIQPLAVKKPRSNTRTSPQHIAAVPDYDLVSGYVNVDAVNGGNIFWYSYKNKDATMQKAPIVIWLQGGPGASSVYGDMCEIGPVDACDGHPKPRNSTWLGLTKALIFIDNPVGTGFSYVKNEAGYARDEVQIAQQLFTTLKAIYAKNPEFTGLPLHIFSESYGGKMSSEFGAYLSDQLKQDASLAKMINFKGVGLGDSWISPLDAVQSYGTFLRGLSHFDENAANKCDKYAENILHLLVAQRYADATDAWGSQQNFYASETGVNVYNFLLHDSEDLTGLGIYVNNQFKKQLGSIPDDVYWQMSSEDVFRFMAVDFMKNSTNAVERLLDAGRNVVVYSGQLDVIVDTLATESWMNKLRWKHINTWKSTNQQSLRGPRDTTANEFSFPIDFAYRKQYQNLDYWRILYAGHMVPLDNPVMGYEMIRAVLNQ